MKLMVMTDIYIYIYIYRLRKIDKIQEILMAEREINETIFVQNITEELILLA